MKLIRLKEGLTKLSAAYSDFARKCALVFDAQQVDFFFLFMLIHKYELAPNISFDI